MILRLFAALGIITCPSDIVELNRGRHKSMYQFVGEWQGVLELLLWGGQSHYLEYLKADSLNEEGVEPALPQNGGGPLPFPHNNDTKGRLGI